VPDGRTEIFDIGIQTAPPEIAVEPPTRSVFSTRGTRRR